MADEDVKGTSAEAGASADAESPREETEVELTGESSEDVSEATEAEPAAEAEADEAAAEAEEAPEAEATEAEAEADEPAAEAEADEPAAEGEADDATTEDGLGTSAQAEVPAKPKRKRLPRALRPKKTRPARVRSAERKPIVRLEKPEHERGRRQERQGTVVSDAMEKSIVVEVVVVKAHPRYKKVVRRSVKFHAHDERSEAKVGDIVRIVETRPLSKTKRWRLVEILEAAK
jgi:small subunit ribosomal protein S17